MSRVCAVCRHQVEAADPVEEARVHSNIRAFVDETFGVWRCPSCASIHAADTVDLAHYYAKYPFHGTDEFDWRLRAMYGNLHRRLWKAGVRPEHRLLDYGCGGGQALRYLGERGFSSAEGYDEFSERFRRPDVLDRTYQALLSQDVLEHVEDPWALLRQLDALVEPGGILALGTPNATAIDLSRPERFHHTLHQPYHLHIFSEQALIDAGKTLGWELVKFYPTMYVNTLVPFVNSRFVLHYFRCFDDTLDVGFDGMRIDSWKLYTPLTIFWALFGYWFSPRTDVMAIFRKPG